MAVYYWEIHINIGYISNGMVYTHDTYISTTMAWVITQV